MKFFLLILLVAAASASYNIRSKRSTYQEIMNIEGIIDCGSAGQTLGIRIEGCSSIPCEFQTGQIYSVEVDFTAGNSHPQLNLSVNIIYLGEIIEVWNVNLENSAVDAGQSYTLTYQYPVQGDFSGLLMVWNEIKGISNPTVEVCALLSARIS